jgi:hypothetical protein
LHGHLQQTFCLLNLLCPKPVKFGIQNRVFAVAFFAFFDGLFFGKNLVRIQVARRIGVAFDAANGFPMQLGIGKPTVHRKQVFVRRFADQAGQLLPCLVAGKANGVISAHNVFEISFAIGGFELVRIVTGEATEFIAQFLVVNAFRKLLLPLFELESGKFFFLMAIGAVKMFSPQGFGMWVSQETGIFVAMGAL